MPACQQLFNIFHPYDPVAYSAILLHNENSRFHIDACLDPLSPTGQHSKGFVEIHSTQHEDCSESIGGTLFLFDRKALRYFRKYGYNWRKKKDGKTVKEAHQKLKLISLKP